MEERIIAAALDQAACNQANKRGVGEADPIVRQSLGVRLTRNSICTRAPAIRPLLLLRSEWGYADEISPALLQLGEFVEPFRGFFCGHILPPHDGRSNSARDTIATGVERSVEDRDREDRYIIVFGHSGSSSRQPNGCSVIRTKASVFSHSCATVSAKLSTGRARSRLRPRRPSRHPVRGKTRWEIRG